MAKKSVTELDFDFSDDGELELTGFDEDDEFIEEDELLDEEEEVEEEEIEEEEIEDQSDSVTVRLTNLEKTIQSLPQMIATSIASALSKTNAKEDEEEEIPDELDNKQVINILARRMQKSVKESVNSAVKEMHENDPAIRDARLTAEFRHCQMKYGQKFTDRMISVAKVIQGVQKAGGKITAEDAFLSIYDPKAASVKKVQPSQKTGGKKSVRVDADSRDSVGSIDKPARPKFDAKKIKEISDTDMFQQAWNSALMSAARSSKRRSA